MTSAKDNEAQASTSFKLFLLTLMVFQTSATILIGRHTRLGKAEDLYDVSHFIFLNECGKFILSCIFEQWTDGKLFQNLKENVMGRPRDALKLAIPALLYWLQNRVVYDAALPNLSAPLFQVTYQSKLVTTAIVSVIMLQRRYSMKQWMCMVGVSLGVAIVVLSEDKSSKKKEDDSTKEEEREQSLFIGLMAVAFACMSSAFAGVYFEKVVKKKGHSESTAPPVSLWMRNIQLSFFSMVICLPVIFKPQTTNVSGGDSSVTNTAEKKPYLFGFTIWVWMLVALNAGGSVLMAAVLKHADNVQKGLATGVSVVVVTALSTFLFETPLTTKFVVGATMILSSVYFFSNDIPAQCHFFRQKEHKESDAAASELVELKVVK